jgi:phosphocarrier protein
MGIERELMIVNELGLHARPATQIVNIVNQFESEIMLTFRGITVDMKSIMGVLSLGVTKGSTILVRAEGPDEVDAINAISNKIKDFNLR